MTYRPTCPECRRTFDLTDPTDAAEWTYGHDCEPADEPEPIEPSRPAPSRTPLLDRIAARQPAPRRTFPATDWTGRLYARP